MYQSPANLTPLALVPGHTDDSHRLYDNEWEDDREPTTEIVTNYVTKTGTDITESSVRKEYLSLMREDAEAFTARFSTLGEGIRTVVASSLGEEDPATTVIFTVGEEEVVIPGNRAHLFCFFNDFGNVRNRPRMDAFYTVVSEALGAVPCSKHYLTKTNDGNRSRATAILLVINEGDRLSFMVIKGWQICPHTVLRATNLIVAEESWSSSMLNYFLPFEGLGESTLHLFVQNRFRSNIRLLSVTARRSAPLHVISEDAADDVFDSSISL